MQAFTLQCAGGSGAAAGASVAACAAPDEADGLGVRPGATIGAPKLALGAVGAAVQKAAEAKDFTALQSAAGSMGASCQGCHSVYRQRGNQQKKQ